jgi:hypothetical protein
MKLIQDLVVSRQFLTKLFVLFRIEEALHSTHSYNWEWQNEPSLQFASSMQCLHLDSFKSPSYCCEHYQVHFLELGQSDVERHSTHCPDLPIGSKIIVINKQGDFLGSLMIWSIEARICELLGISLCLRHIRYHRKHRKSICRESGRLLRLIWAIWRQ